jgi:hypothetical protein
MSKRDTSVIGVEFIEHYNIGDVVRYCGETFQDCVEVKTGIILDISSIYFDDGNFPHAKIYVMGYDKQELVMLSNLTLLYKVSD